MIVNRLSRVCLHGSNYVRAATCGNSVLAGHVRLAFSPLSISIRTAETTSEQERGNRTERGCTGETTGSSAPHRTIHHVTAQRKDGRRTSLQVLTVELVRARAVEPAAQEHVAPPDLLAPRDLCSRRTRARVHFPRRAAEDVVGAREAHEAVELGVGDALAGGEARVEAGEEGEVRGDVRAVGLGGLALVEVVDGHGGERGGVEDVREVGEGAHGRDREGTGGLLLVDGGGGETRGAGGRGGCPGCLPGLPSLSPATAGFFKASYSAFHWKEHSTNV